MHKDVDVRYRNVAGVIAEIEEISVAAPDVKCIRVLDDLFPRNEKSIIDAIEIFSSFSHLSWRGMAHIMTFGKQSKHLCELKKCGCIELSVGIESGSERIRQKIHKPGSCETIERVIREILAAGIDVKAYFMFDFSSETLQEAEQTEVLAKRFHNISKGYVGKFRTSVFQFRPYHGTALYEEIINGGGIIGTLSKKLSIQFQDYNNYELSPVEYNGIICAGAASTIYARL